MATLKYRDPVTGEYKPIAFVAKGDKGDDGDPGPPGGFGPLDQLSDVAAPSDTPVGKVLGTTDIGLWGPIDPPPTGLDTAAGDARYVNHTGPETLTGDFTVTGLLKGGTLESAGGVKAAGKVTDVTAPTDNTDAANKGYVDSRIWTGTQAQYDASPKDPNVLYVVV